MTRNTNKEANPNWLGKLEEQLHESRVLLQEKIIELGNLMENKSLDNDEKVARTKEILATTNRKCAAIMGLV